MINNAFKILFWFIYSIAFVAAFAVTAKLLPSFKRAVMNRFLFSGTISFFMLCLLPFGYSCFMEIQNISKTLPFKLVSVASAFFMMITIFFFLYSQTMVVFKCVSHMHNEQFTEQFKSVLLPLKRRPLCLLFYPLYSWKRIFQVVFTVLFIDDPPLQVLINASLTFLVISSLFILPSFCYISSAHSHNKVCTAT